MQIRIPGQKGSQTNNDLGLQAQSAPTKTVKLKPSLFIRPVQARGEISIDAAKIRVLLESGWVGQIKTRGHYAQIHIPSSSGSEVVAYTRSGERHKKLLPQSLEGELRMRFAPASGWTVIDCEWIKTQNRLYVFDCLKLAGKMLAKKTFGERHALLESASNGLSIVLLPMLASVEECLSALETHNEAYEGLLFHKADVAGFDDSHLLRARSAL
jgi:hypothetical protein